MNQLELVRLNKHYGKKYALKNFSFTFKNGVYALLGPNGAGKSTIMNLITDNLTPDKDSGEILWNDIPIKKLGSKYRNILGFMPQQQELYSNMTAWDFMGYISALKNISKKQAKEEIENALKLVELDDAANKKNRWIFRRYEAKTSYCTNFIGRSQADYYGRTNSRT